MGGSEVLTKRWKASCGDEMANFQRFVPRILRNLYDQLVRRFKRARITGKQLLLDGLAALGQIKKVEKGRLAA